MLFVDIVASVVTVTNRPDLVAETQLAVRRATARLHGCEYFPRDLTTAVVSAAGYSGSIDVTSAPISRYRAAKYLRESLATPTGQERYLTKIEPDSLVDSYGRSQLNYWWEAGNVLNWSLGVSLGSGGTALSSLVLGYYQNPDVSIAGYDVAGNSWIATTEPWCIIEEAAAKVLRLTGQLDVANALQMQADESRRELIISHLEGVGR
jgi:hypothetical protein